MRAATGMIVTGITIISFISSLSGNTVHAGPVTYGQLNVYGTGYGNKTDGDGHIMYDPEYESRSFNYSSDVGISESESLISYSQTKEGILEVNTSSAITSRNGNLGVYAASSGRVISSAEGNITWSDSVQLVSPPVGGHRLSDSLVLNFTIEGELVTQGSGTDREIGNIWSSVFGYFSDQTYYAELQTDYRNPEDQSLIISDVVNSRLDLSDGYGEFSYNLAAYTYSDDGSASSNFINTLTLKSITFADGTTPESHGYSLIFGSGMVSPNVSSVPEPSTLALAGLGGIGVALSAYRRRRLAA
ncbi:PEP-CTERM sorting domain-containing protein [Schlesneria sp. T3-172]|uniref:PEP-CTERM sorting domain-containing protein n=1 Tax=Schlesneria sphaerica TaxID=3373610 RepID=UPI0037C87875